MRFADEPLYQFYAADISKRTKSVFAGDIMEDCDGYEEISSITSRPSALELITPCTSGHGQHRSLWCEVPEVKNSGIIDSLTPRERKLQEAKFELITSEASYFKSLTVLEKHFINSHSMNDDTILSKKNQKILFGNVNAVRKCSEKLLAALEKCWQDNILLSGLSEILYTHSKENFDIFVKYCSNQIYIDRTLKSLRENQKFNEALQRLESDPKCQSLSLHSFLMLPMQRITRLPLLVDAILSQMDLKENALEYQMCELTLASLNAIVQNCNESTRKLERYEEMLLLSQQLEFSSKKEMKAMSVASSSRWLVRSGSMLHLTGPDAKLTFSRKLIRPTKLYFFLFNDMFFIAKRKSDGNYTVIDYCARNFVEMEHTTELIIPSSYKNLLKLTILENHEGKTVEMLLSCDSESSKKRWIEAMSPPISSNPEETLYNEWDCPQVFSEHPYVAVQPDELSLQNGDIVKVLTKMNDGWYHGERIRDGEKGWFPGNYTTEIASQHARAKNLKQRYRLLAMSGSYLQSRQDKIKKKKSSQII
uniref:Ephexin-1 n=2 Tax=Melanaphis sacchari TaxID=742174 RepID=A0A2H8U1M9_9HEMI